MLIGSGWFQIILEGKINMEFLWNTINWMMSDLNNRTDKSLLFANSQTAIDV